MRRRRDRRPGQAQGGKDKARDQPHVQPRDGQEVCKVGAAQGLRDFLGQTRAVAGHDRRGKGPGVPCQHRPHPRRQGHAGAEHAGRARFGRQQGQHGLAGVADRAKPGEPAVTAEIKAARLDRPAGGRKMGCRQDRQPRSRRDEPLLSVQRNAHPVRGARRGNLAQAHPVQRQAHRVRGRAVDADHPSLDRAVVAPAQHRRGDGLRAHRRQRRACGDQRQRPDQRRQRRPGAPRQQRDGHSPGGQGGDRRAMGFDRQAEIRSNAERQGHRHPREQMAALT